MNPRQLLTLKTAVLLRLETHTHGPEDFNVTVTHLVGRVRSAAEDNKRVIFTVEEVAWDKDQPTFYKLGPAYGLCGPGGAATAEVDLRVDNVKAWQKLEPARATVPASDLDEVFG